jgi:glycosyltransferase 2 family protein
MAEPREATPAQEQNPPPAEENNSSSHLGRKILLAVIVGLSINVLLSFCFDFKQMLSALARATPWQIFVPFAAICVVYVIDCLRYYIVFRQFGVRLSFRDALYNNVIGYFFSCITPSSAGGQPFQIYHFVKLGLDTTTSTNIIFSRLMVTNFAQLVVILAIFHRGIALLGSTGNGAYVLALGMVSTALISVILLLVFIKPTLIGHLAFAIEQNRLGRFIGKVSKNERWAEKLSNWTFELRDSFRFLWSRRTLAVLADVLLFYFVQVVWAFGLYYPLCGITGTRLPFVDFLFAFIVCGLVSAYIPTPGASGSVEASYALVLGGMTGSPGAALSAIFLWRIGSYYLHLLLGGIVYFGVPTARSVYETRSDGTIGHVRRHPAALRKTE